MQLFHAISFDIGLHYLSTGHRLITQRRRLVHDSTNTHLHCAGGMVISSRSQHFGRLGSGEEQGGAGYISNVSVLCSHWLPLFY